MCPCNVPDMYTHALRPDSPQAWVYKQITRGPTIQLVLLKILPLSPLLQHEVMLKPELGPLLRPTIKYPILVVPISLPHPKISTILLLPTLPHPSLPYNLMLHNSMSHANSITKTSLSLTPNLPLYLLSSHLSFHYLPIFTHCKALFTNMIIPQVTLNNYHSPLIHLYQHKKNRKSTEV